MALVTTAQPYTAAEPLDSEQCWKTERATRQAPMCAGNAGKFQANVDWHATSIHF